MRFRDSGPNKQRGAVAIIIGLSLTVLVGFAGLALDLGRLYVNKTELQSAADACALAAANELVCDVAAVGTCPASYLLNAEASGIFVGGKGNKDFQDNAVTIAPGDVRFSTTLGPNSSYEPRGSADPNSKFAMCITRATGITPYFMGVLGIGAQAVTATAVATLSPGQTSCNALPIGICKKPGMAAPDFGYTVGEWIGSTFNSGANRDESLDGNFRWVDFTISAGGNSEIRDQLAGNGAACGLRVGDDIRQPGTQQGAKSAYNTRFGIYPNGANAYTPQTAPPDKTGYAYPNKAPGSPVIPVGTSAYGDYVSRQSDNDPFISSEYAPTGAAGNIPGNPISASDHAEYGAERRLVGVPMIDCDTGTNQVPILGMACALMLNPMSNGATGTIYIEYRGPANDAGSPCRSAGLPGSITATGPLVPTLVQ
ncbi:pilus assembly protein TadG-related protein [Thauera aromatica]|uniref:pilus assembly protein TadG-related protein n=1 Tax=Thauera aromatica TaxID=59405 RepID=UPI001FFCACEE|nr:pilus assembly protein TadG-related protein [Thauera aromatica]MCK2086927.1 pilus assembly protein TadG-related protein [Thauera aromatica]